MSEPVKPLRLDGTELAGYLIGSLVGRGTTGYVYRAEDRSLARLVALKVLAPDMAGDEEFRRRFLRESQLAASLDHPNILPIYDAGETDGLLYIAMRYVQGSNLREVIAAEHPLEIAYLLDILSQVADALDAAHARGLVHRDVKPANILISPASADGTDHHVYVSDFGVTARAAERSDPTGAGPFVGTLSYLAPEQIRGEPVSARTDVYALGCVCYECLTGSAPFTRDDDQGVLTAHLDEAVAPIPDRRPDVPPSVQAVVATAMAKNAEDRYASCGAFVAALSVQLGGDGARARPGEDRDRPPPEPVAAQCPRPSPVRRRRTVAGILAAVVALTAALVVFQLNSTERFTGTQAIPVSLTYPAHWRRAGDGPQLVLSPQAADLLPLFATRGGPQAWARTSEVLRDSPAAAVGLLITVVPTDDASRPVDQQRGLLQSFLPGNVEFTDVPSSASLGGSAANRVDAELNDPADSTTRLRLQCYTALIRTPERRTVILTFFSSAKLIDYNRATFDRIARSVRLPT